MCPSHVLLRSGQTCAPLRLFVEHPELQVELQLHGLLFPFLHGRQPVAGTVEGCVDHLKLLQTQLVDELLLHNIQLWEKNTPSASSNLTD